MESINTQFEQLINGKEPYNAQKVSELIANFNELRKISDDGYSQKCQIEKFSRLMTKRSQIILSKFDD